MTQILIELGGTVLVAAGTIFGVLRYGPLLHVAQQNRARQTPKS